MLIVPENKALFVCFVCILLCVFVMCTFVLVKQYKIMTNICIFAHFFFFLFHFYLWLYNREIILAVLLRQNSKTNMTNNPDISKRKP